MSHSFVMAHESEGDAFGDIVLKLNSMSTLLVDAGGPIAASRMRPLSRGPGARRA